MHFGQIIVIILWIIMFVFFIIGVIFVVDYKLYMYENKLLIPYIYHKYLSKNNLGLFLISISIISNLLILPILYDMV